MQLALDRGSNQQVAIKFLARFGTEFDARTVARELANHKMCAGHPHIVQLKVRPARGPHPAGVTSAASQRHTVRPPCMLCPAQEVFLTSHYLAIVMDYVSGGDLSQLIDLQWQQGVRCRRPTLLQPSTPAC